MPQWPENIRGTGVRFSRPTQDARDVLLDAQRQGLRVREEGGQLLFMSDPGPILHGPATVEGIVFDSTRKRPLAGATVFLKKSRKRTRTDPDGHFTISGLPEGSDEIGFLHPYSDAVRLPVSLQPVLIRADQPSWVDLFVPAGPGCPVPAEGPEGSVVSGVVYSAEDGRPVSGARVSVEWRTRNSAGRGAPAQDWVRSARTTDDGTFLFCNLPAGLGLRIQARHEDGSAETELMIQRPGLIRQHLVIR
jgi:hypothetical protein